MGLDETTMKATRLVALQLQKADPLPWMRVFFLIPRMVAIRMNSSCKQKFYFKFFTGAMLHFSMSSPKRL